jgi:hypothetical protein
MALWQVIAIAVLVVIAALIGTLLIYARVLTNRIGSTNATLKRIEEALLATDRVTEHAPTTAAEPMQSIEAAQAPQSPEASVSADVSVSHEVSVKEDGAGYLTLRDLKVIARAVDPDRQSAVAIDSESRDSLSTSGDALRTSDQPLVAATSLPVNEVSGDSVSASAETPDALNMSGEVQNSPDSSAESADAIEKRDRDALVVLNTQRRRRRARAGQ